LRYPFDIVRHLNIAKRKALATGAFCFIWESQKRGKLKTRRHKMKNYFVGSLYPELTSIIRTIGGNVLLPQQDKNKIAK